MGQLAVEMTPGLILWGLVTPEDMAMTTLGHFIHSLRTWSLRVSWAVGLIPRWEQSRQSPSPVECPFQLLPEAQPGTHTASEATWSYTE